MRPLLGILLVISLTLAGCTTPGGGPDNETNETNEGTNGGGATPSPTPTPPPDGPPPPSEQRVDDPDDVDEPGEYALLPTASDGNGEEWEVPSWKIGDRWLYEHQVHAAGAGVTVEVEDRVRGTGTLWDLDVYQITRTERDCKADDGDCERTLNLTQDDLVEIEENGYIEHNFVFPMEDGMRWIYARSDGGGGVSKVRAEARHEPDYAWPGPTDRVEAWALVLKHEGDGNVEQRYWLGEDQKNVLRREIWTDYQGVPQMVFSSTLKSYTVG